MTGFDRIEKKKDAFEKDIGKYKIFYLSSGLSFSGKLQVIDDGWLLLNPYVGVGYDAEKGLIRKFIDDPDDPVEFMKGEVIGKQRTSEQDLRNLCEYSNKHPESEQKKKDEPK
ncbi:hypothetical protein HYT26_04580 [Candidatus Pacearchaeota archaeon]|nr:hypothetical protein [Candidatus Pacearchaeota archaeon]